MTPQLGKKLFSVLNICIYSILRTTPQMYKVVTRLGHLMFSILIDVT